MKKVLLTGPAPHNIGGISNHLLRLSRLLSADFAFDFIDEGHKREKGIFNIRSLNPFAYLGKVFSADIVHVNSGSIMLRIFHLIVCRLILRKPTIVTIHRDITIENRKKLTRWLLSKCNHVIVVNEKSKNALTGIIDEKRLTKLPAFLPPSAEEFVKLPEDVTAFIEKGGMIMVSNAWKLVTHDGVDLYGLDSCIEALGKLPEDYKLVFVIADPTGSDDTLYKYDGRISQLNIADRIMIYKSSLSFVELISKADIVLRTTCTDGDAISIREALHQGKRVIASDVVERPEGTELFRTRDVDSLVETILHKNAVAKNVSPDKHATIDYRNIYSTIYNSIIQN